jgi:E3 ubiquitin-protein ligase RBBP6
MSIYYKFRSARDFDTLPIDGPNITLVALKKAIIAAKKLGKGIDFDLEIVDAQTGIGKQIVNSFKFLKTLCFFH